MKNTQVLKSLVRLIAPNGIPVGLGFMFSSRFVLCTASSVSASLGLDQFPTTAPEDDVSLYINNNQPILGHVVAWHPPHADSNLDAAVVELDDSFIFPQDLPALAFLEGPANQPMQAVCPDNGRLISVNDIVQVLYQSLAPTGGIFVKELNTAKDLRLPGGLGSPVWLDQGIIGIINLADTPQGIYPVVMPLELIAPIFPDLPVRLPGAQPGILYGVPDTDPDFIGRQEEFQVLRSALLGVHHTLSLPGDIFGTTAFTTLTSTGPIDSLRSDRIVLHGIPGIGKTSLAASVLRDSLVRRIYPDGIFWLTLGKEPDLLSLQARLIHMVGGGYQNFQDVAQGRRILRSLLFDKRCLLVLDDVWDGATARMLDCLGTRGMLLVLGRESGLVGTLHAQNIPLGPLPAASADQLLRKLSGVAKRPLNLEERQLLLQCEGIPLAICLLAGIIKFHFLNEKQIVAQIGNFDIQAFSSLEEYLYLPLLKMMNITVRYLPVDIRERLVEMVIFPAGNPIPVSVLQTYWKPKGISAAETEEIISLISKYGLLKYDTRLSPANAINLHDFVLAYLSLLAGDTALLHRAFVLAYGILPPLPDGYILDHLAGHMIAANMQPDLLRLLLDYGFLARRLANGTLASLLADFRLALSAPELSLWDRGSGCEGLLFIQTAIRQSAPFLIRNPQSLAAQLIGRLAGIPEPHLDQLLASVRKRLKKNELVPLGQSLSWPGKKHIFSLKGHTAPIRCIAVTLDGLNIISSGDDKTIRIWDAMTGRCTGVLSGHTASVCALAPTPDGQHFISGGDDGDLILWKLAEKQPIRILHDATSEHGRVLALNVSSDGRRAIASYADRKILLWNLEYFRLLREFDIDNDQARAINILPGSLKAASAGRTIRIWDLETGQVMMSLPGHTGNVNALLPTNDGQRLISAADDHTIRIWDIQNGIELRTLFHHGGAVMALAQVPGLHMIVSAGADNLIRTWDLDSGRLVSSIESQSSQVNALAITPDGRRLISGGERRLVNVWDFANRRLLRSIKGPLTRNSAVILTQDGKFAISASADGALRMWELASGKQTRLIQEKGSNIYALALASDNRRLFSAAEDGILTMFDLLDASKPATPIGEHLGAVLGVAVTPDGSRVVTASADSTLRIWDISPTEENKMGTGELIATLYGHSSWVRSVACLPDNWRAVSVSADHTMKLWDLDSGALIYSVEAHQGEINDVAVLERGLRVVTAGDDRLLRVWDVETGHPQFTLTGHTGEVNAVAATPEKSRIVSVSHDRSVRVWDLPTRRKATPGSSDDLNGPLVQATLDLEDHADWIHTVAITPDGKRAISASEDTSLKIWDISIEGDASLGRVPDLLPMHTGGATAFDFSRDGRYGLSAGADGVIRFWHFERGTSGLVEKSTCKETMQTKSPVLTTRFFPDGVRVAASTADGAVCIWDVDRSFEPLRKMVNGNLIPHLLAITPDSRRLIIGNDTRLQIWDVLQGCFLMEHQISAPVLSLAPLPSSRMAVGVLEDGRLIFWDIYTDRISEIPISDGLPPSTKFKAAAFETTEFVLAMVTQNGRAMVWNLASLKPTGHRQIIPPVQMLAPTQIDGDFKEVVGLDLTNRGQRLAIACGGDFSLHNTASGKQIALFNIDAGLLGCRGAKNGAIYLVGDDLGRIHLLRAG